MAIRNWDGKNIRENYRIHCDSHKNKSNSGSKYEDSFDTSIYRLEDNLEKHERRLITAIRNDTDNTIDNRMTITTKQ